MKAYYPPVRLPLNAYTLLHIAGKCKSNAGRQRLLKREIELVLANVAWGFIDQAQGILTLDNIRAMIGGAK